MKYLLFFIVLFTSSNIFAAPATKDDIKMLIQQMDKRFEAVDKRFEAVDKRFEDMHRYTDRRFEDMNKRFEMIQHQMDKRFELLTNILIFCFSILGASMGFLYHRQSSMMKSIGSLESSVQAILERMERTDASIQAILGRLERTEVSIQTILERMERTDTSQAILESPRRPQINLNHNTIDIDAFVLTLQNSDEQTKRKLREVLEVH